MQVAGDVSKRKIERKKERGGNTAHDTKEYRKEKQPELVRVARALEGQRPLRQSPHEASR